MTLGTGPALDAQNEPDPNPDESRTDPTPTVESGKIVQYIGASDIREINEESWRSIGSKSGFTRWNARNRWRVDAADLDDTALDYLDSDPDFVVKDALA